MVSKYLFSILLHGSTFLVFATSPCSTNSGQNGICITTSECRDGDGIPEAGHCPGSADIQVSLIMPFLVPCPNDAQCCTYGTCYSNGVTGLCQPTSTCEGTKTPGLCLGDSSIQCCTYGKCTANGNSGTCKLNSTCSGVSTPGLCPGPANIQCCTNNPGDGGGSDCGPPQVNQATLDLIEDFEGWFPHACELIAKSFLICCSSYHR